MRVKRFYDLSASLAALACGLNDHLVLHTAPILWAEALSRFHWVGRGDGWDRAPDRFITRKPAMRYLIPDIWHTLHALQLIPMPS
ncbi:hypothetical protein [Sulfobacillus thermosulfidooxidans]|uniref:hypothetical protein n=1 Tax=Sulfobacillus thermosulfidooxidans TaxID=28034 RepID=UPI0006B6902E|nr:hypothetical protein [Sulfobacillus thermosulfidooxidans]